MRSSLRTASTMQLATRVASRPRLPLLRALSTGIDDKLIRIVEVAPRDGLQNIPPPAVPTSIKTELIKKLLDCGLKTIEVGSFVRPDRVPQVRQPMHTTT